ncbi:MAG: HD domain-containing protein [Lentisphaeria bacterium]|nr:HD domain-containing protein [Candidatus Neomarinimicrobiota bacterium]MCF7842485.1 HD domain-containing protein [Lentisphaeria bacterium]
MSPKLTRIADFKPGKPIQGFFLVKEIHQRITRTDQPYRELVLQDKTGTVNAKIWHDAKAFKADCIAGDAVVVQGTVSEYRGQLQLELKKLGQATPEKHAEYGFNPTDLLPASPYDIDTMWQELTAILEGMENPFLQQLVTQLYEQHADQIKTHPASMFLHHAVYGGYLEHVLSMAKVGQWLAGHYEVDRDLFLTGILLHDIGKIVELRPVNQPGYTPEGILIGHVVIGRDMARAVMAGIEDFPEELQLKVEHLILSHQGTYEWQSPKKPKFLEAMLLHMIDEMDARVNMFRSAVEQDQEPGSFTNRYNYFRLNLLKGPLNRDADDDADAD